MSLYEKTLGIYHNYTGDCAMCGKKLFTKDSYRTVITGPLTRDFVCDACDTKQMKYCRGMADAAEGVGDMLTAKEYRRIADELDIQLMLRKRS